MRGTVWVFVVRVFTKRSVQGNGVDLMDEGMKWNMNVGFHNDIPGSRFLWPLMLVD